MKKFGMIALIAIVGIVTVLMMQGRSDAAAEEMTDEEVSQLWDEYAGQEEGTEPAAEMPGTITITLTECDMTLQDVAQYYNVSATDIIELNKFAVNEVDNLPCDRTLVIPKEK